MTARPELSVYLVTDRDQCAGGGRSVAETVRAAVAGGVRTVQLRDKDAGGGSFLDDVLAVAEVLAEVRPEVRASADTDAEVTLIINDRVDVFLAARAAGAPVHGVHVGQQDLPVHLVRELVGPEPIIGLSVSTEDELTAAADSPARVDHVGIGPLHPTSTKRGAPPALGLPRCRELIEASRLPAVIIGGVTAADLPTLRRSGAAGAAVVSAICRSADPQAAAARLVSAWTED